VVENKNKFGVRIHRWLGLFSDIKNSGNLLLAFGSNNLTQKKELEIWWFWFVLTRNLDNCHQQKKYVL
jgi:hypothetical protein